MSQSQSTYISSPYQKESWEVIGERSVEQDFVAESFSIIASQGLKVDPMFRDYGGITSADQESVVHGNRNALDEIKKKAQQDEQVKIKAKLEFDEAIKNAFAKGRESALKETEAHNIAKIKQLETRCGELIDELSNALEKQIIAIADQAISLSLQVSKKIIGYAVEINPEYITRLIRDAVKMAGTAKIQCIRVSPEDLEFLNVIGKVTLLGEEISKIEFVADQNIKSGCLIQSSAGTIDYRLDQAFERLQSQIVTVER